jgi:magnesium and cobalt transporter
MSKPGSEDAPSPKPEKPSLLERLSALILREPEDREQLIELLHGAFERQLMDADALSIIEGALQVSELTAGDIMIPRAQMDVISVAEKPEQFIPFVIETRHSRFPVIGDNKDDVIGILLAKDLLQYYAQPEEFNLREMLRPAVFIPESKRLNVLLRDFRANRNHMALVVDEYGGVAGLVTIEDVLEQIVGEIEDEYDFDETEDDILQEAPQRYRVKAQCATEDFNTRFGTDFDPHEFDTIGGVLLRQFGRLPKRGDSVSLGGLHFEVLRADSRRLYTLVVEGPPAPAGSEEKA